MSLCEFSGGELNLSPEEHLIWFHKWLVIGHSTSKCAGVSSIISSFMSLWHASFSEFEECFVKIQNTV